MSNNFEPCAEMQSSRNGVEFPEYSLIPENFWPKEATDNRSSGKYPYWRDTPWKDADYNEENKKLIVDAVEQFKKTYPDYVGDVLESDLFWGEFGTYSMLVEESIKRRDYVLETDYKSWVEVKKHLKNFDVYIRFNILSGLMELPEIYFNLKYSDGYSCNVEYDDYAQQEIEKVWSKYHTEKSISGEKKPVSRNSDELLRQWRKHGYKEWKDKQVQMIREGHGKYILKYQGRDVRGTRKSVEKKNGEYVIHDNHY